VPTIRNTRAATRGQRDGVGIVDASTRRAVRRKELEMGTEALARNWWALAIRGAAAVIFGVLAFLMPVVTLATLVLLFGIYATVDGIFTLIAAIRGHGDLPRWAMVIEGLVSLGAGAATFTWPGITTLILIYVIAGWALVTGVLEIAAAIRLRKEIQHEWLLALSGVASLALAALLIAAPAFGALALVLWIGTYAIVFGVILIGLSLRLRRAQRVVDEPMARAA
jgi:uncharacterized membrane protein HdeD (DUF308 family)